MIFNSLDARQLFGRILSLPTGLTILWLFAVWWGERSAFESSLKSCQWAGWESWPAGSKPHHVVLIADPQLVDPHTYPGRPWPLSTLTVWYTDLYLRRSYRLLQDYLEPDTLFFLGDLFDGGREWGTQYTISPEKRYQKYGTKFWMKEYNRFVALFLKGWQNGPQGSWREPRGRKIISSLPGNHDLGFAGGIQPAVKNRFDAYFGPLNRIDVVGNHTFVSLDTVSLSAMDQVDPVTGSSGLGDGTAAATASSVIWKPVYEFLDEAKNAKARAVQREVYGLTSNPEAIYTQDSLASLSINITSLEDAPAIHRRPNSIASAKFPTVLLTHVPLFRAPDTHCGPFRERGTALSISGGYQYQNVLTPLVSKDIISKLGVEEVTQVYSGDDHDYCEIDHLEFTGRIKEITVKSMSWAMGVRRPGFLAVSLHNPVDLGTPRANMRDTGTPKDTIQNHLCLLPDQLGIFMRYGQLLGLTVVILAIRALLIKPGHSPSYSPKVSRTPLLPLSEDKSLHPANHQHSDSHTSQSSSNHHHHLSTTSTLRPSAAVPRPSSPSKSLSLGGYGNLPASSRSSSPVKNDPFFPSTQTPYPRHQSKHSHANSDDWSTSPPRTTRRGIGKLFEFRQSVIHVAMPVLTFYLWLVWNG